MGWTRNVLIVKDELKEEAFARLEGVPKAELHRKDGCCLLAWESRSGSLDLDEDNSFAMEIDGRSISWSTTGNRRLASVFGARIEFVAGFVVHDDGGMLRRDRLGKRLLALGLHVGPCEHCLPRRRMAGRRAVRVLREIRDGLRDVAADHRLQPAHRPHRSR